MTGSAPLRIGLTGGVASGKSTVADMFAQLGAVVIDTDQIARDVVKPGQPALREIESAFGPEVLTADGTLDRRRMRELVFADPERRHQLESILHPKIRARTLELAESAGGPYQLLVVPLLLETGFGELVDRVLVVDCPETMQRQRLLQRDGEDPAQAERMMAAQTGRQARLAVADDIIDNSGPLSATAAQVEKLHHYYLELAGRRDQVGSGVIAVQPPRDAE